MIRLRLVVSLAAVALGALVPVAAAAHPLGNFTINHYAGLRIGIDRILLDVVIDQAEIPSFQERQRIDTDGDGSLSDEEIAAERTGACPRLADSLVLRAGPATLRLAVAAAGLSFPAGAGGVPTMRLVCEYEAVLPARIAGATAVHFEDRSNPGRIGWREIVVNGDGTILTGDLPATSLSARLTSYPQDLLSQALDVRGASVTAMPGGPVLPPFSAPDAYPVAVTASPAPGAMQVAGARGASPEAVPAAVPGGVGGEIAGLLGATDLTPLVVLVSFFSAIALGAGHALTPGHGKTIMAAYLVGTRGSFRQAMGLGLATAVSHTIGVLVLALLIIAAGGAFPADRVYPILTAISGLIVIAIGAWLLAAPVARWLRSPRRPASAPAFVPVAASGGPAGAHAPRAADSRSQVHTRGHRHSHDPRANGHARAHQPGPAAPRRYGQAYALFQPAAATATAAGTRAGTRAGTATGTATRVATTIVEPLDPGLHRHGWRVHSHVPATAGGESPALTWKRLFALGLSGGLVPSTNALLILVGTVAAGRAAYGLVLVVAFGIGMAAVLAGVGLAMVYASGLLGRVPRSAPLSRLASFAPTVAALAVLALGLYLTQQAIAGGRVF